MIGTSEGGSETEMVVVRVGVVAARLLGLLMLLSGLNSALALAGQECTLGDDGLYLIAGLLMIPAGIHLMALKRWAAVAVCLCWWLAAVRYHYTLAQATIPVALTIGTLAGWRRLANGV